MCETYVSPILVLPEHSQTAEQRRFQIRPPPGMILIGASCEIMELAFSGYQPGRERGGGSWSSACADHSTPLKGDGNSISSPVPSLQHTVTHMHRFTHTYSHPHTHTDNHPYTHTRTRTRELRSNVTTTGYELLLLQCNRNGDYLRLLKL